MDPPDISRAQVQNREAATGLETHLRCDRRRGE